jgi:hypothetical protein
MLKNIKSSSMRLPIELYDKIAFSLPTRKSLQLSDYMEYKLGSQEKDVIEYIRQNCIIGVKKLIYNRIHHGISINDYSIILEAYKYKRHGILYFLLNYTCDYFSYGKWLLYLSAKHNELDMIKWFWKYYPGDFTVDIIDTSYVFANEELTHWLETNTKLQVSPMCLEEMAKYKI